MELQLDWATFGSIVVALGALVSYGLKKYIDFKLNIFTASRLDVLKKHYEKYYESLWQSQKFLAEISHCIDHINMSHEEYKRKCRELCMELRRRSREDTSVLGRDYVDRIKNATDTALEYTEIQSDNLMNKCQLSISKLQSEIEIKRSNIFKSHMS